MISQGYFPVVGGAERQLASLAPRLQRAGVDVAVYTKAHDGARRFERIEDVAVHRQPVSGGKAARSLRFTFGTLRQLRRRRPDVIHAHDLLSPTTTALLAKRLYGVPVVAKVVRGGEIGDINWLRRRRFGAQRLAWIRARVDRFVCISNEITHELHALGVEPARCVAIPNGVDAQRFRPPQGAERERLRRELGLSADPIVVFSGRLAAEKRVDALIALWPEVRRSIPNAGLCLVGTGDQRAALEAQAGPGVRFTGPVDDVAPWLRAADAFVLPSRAEGLSNALLEAMASGLACIATDVGGAPEVIDTDAAGLLIPAGDDMALRDALLAVLGDAPRREAMGIQARRRMLADYALDSVADRLAALYRDVVAASRDR